MIEAFARVIPRRITSVTTRLGLAAVFMEVHQDPDRAPSDGPNMVKLKDFPALLEQLVEIDRVVKKRPA